MNFRMEHPKKPREAADYANLLSHFKVFGQPLLLSSQSKERTLL